MSWIPEIVQFLLMRIHINSKANLKSTDWWALPLMFSDIEDSPVHIYSFDIPFNFLSSKVVTHTHLLPNAKF